MTIDYSDCASLAPPTNDTNEMADIPSDKVTSHFKNTGCTSKRNSFKWSQHQEYINYGIRGEDRKVNQSTICTMEFVIPENIGPPVFFYYRLTNFYQNHRRYVKSLDTNQLKGKAVSRNVIKDGSCDPLQTDDASGKPYYPCGLIANSLFNDTFTSPEGLNLKDVPGGHRVYNMTHRGIAWDSDKALYGQTKYQIDEIAVPRNWAERYPNGYTEQNPPPNLDQDEDFQVWMRTAGLPTFSKLAMRNDDDVMACGTYRIDVQMST